jgi:hypothetical protein
VTGGKLVVEQESEARIKVRIHATTWDGTSEVGTYARRLGPCRQLRGCSANLHEDPFEAREKSGKSLR